MPWISASTPQHNLPIIPYKVTIVANQMNALSFIPHFHLQKSTGMVDISNISVERVVTDPELPGFQMRIPAGAQIIGCDACAVNESASFMAVCGDPALKCIPREASLAWDDTDRFSCSFDAADVGFCPSGSSSSLL